MLRSSGQTETKHPAGPLAEPCRDALDRWILAATGETLRLLGPATEAVRALDLEAASDWTDHVDGLRRRYGVWVDVESVAVSQCGFPPSSSSDDDDEAWLGRQKVLDEAYKCLLRALQGHPQSHLIAETLERWAERYHLTAFGCGLRLPPCFAAACGEALALVLLEQHPYAASGYTWKWDQNVIDAAQRDASPHPWPAPSLSFLFGWCDGAVTLANLQQVAAAWLPRCPGS